jgi:hypothetical protein
MRTLRLPLSWIVAAALALAASGCEATKLPPDGREP